VICVDPSVWIEYFNERKTPQTDRLDAELVKLPIVTGDLILTEMLQGFQSDMDFTIARDLLSRIPCMPMLGKDLALESAANYRLLRKKSVTVRKTIDVMIGTFCIYYRLPLLHDDRDFDPMEKFLGLDVTTP
jgi:predicted nucleic acid-binding protein